MLQSAGRFQPNALLGVLVVEEEAVLIRVSEPLNFRQSFPDMRAGVQNGRLRVELNGLADQFDLLSSVVLLHDGDAKPEVSHDDDEVVSPSPGRSQLSICNKRREKFVRLAVENGFSTSESSTCVRQARRKECKLRAKKRRLLSS